jgi:thiol-disulfide isomerase/thioredoxin
MKRVFALLAGLGVTAGLHAAELLPVEQQVAEAVKSSRVTVVHLWAPWCPNCKAELAKDGWSTFINTNADVDFIFVTVWRGEEGDGRALLEKNGVGVATQKNFSLLVHPNVSRKQEDKMTEFLGLPVTWIPSTWVFRDGRLRYALNYGELHFPMLQQLIRDSSDKWAH